MRTNKTPNIPAACEHHLTLTHQLVQVKPARRPAGFPTQSDSQTEREVCFSCQLHLWTTVVSKPVYLPLLHLALSAALPRFSRGHRNTNSYMSALFSPCLPPLSKTSSPCFFLVSLSKLLFCAAVYSDPSARRLCFVITDLPLCPWAWRHQVYLSFIHNSPIILHFCFPGCAEAAGGRSGETSTPPFRLM